MRLYGWWKGWRYDVSNRSYVSRGKPSTRYKRILIRRPLKKRARQEGTRDIQRVLIGKEPFNTGFYK